jgi:hypothetical protein
MTPDDLTPTAFRALYGGGDASLVAWDGQARLASLSSHVPTTADMKTGWWA